MLARVTNHLEEGVISLLLVGMTLLVFVEVVMRFVFSAGFLWIQELTLHVSAWMVLLGASYGIKVGAHIGVDAVVRLLSPPARRAVSMVAVALSLFYCSLFAYGAWVYLGKVYKIGIELEDMAVPKWLAHSVLFIGFILLAIRLLQLMWALIKGEADGFNVADEAAEALKHLEQERAGKGTAGAAGNGEAGS